MADEFVDKVLKLIKKDFGENIAIAGDKFLSKKTRTIPLSPLGDVALNGGIPEGSWFTLSGKPKCGKMQPLYSKVLTPIGFKTMGEITINEVVCTPDGETTKVINIFEHTNKNVYRVSFDDSSYADCGLEHLWKVRTKTSDWQVLSLEHIINNFESSRKYTWFVPLTKAVNFEARKTSIHPYLLGCILGDGGISGRDIRFTNIDEFLINKFNSLLEDGYVLKLQSKSNKDYILTSNRQTNKYLQILTNYGLMGLTSHHKYIPKDFIYNDIDTRLQLIQGLMDTDGSISKRGHCEYTSVSTQLIEGFKELVESLGFKTKIVERFTKCNGKSFKSYRCHVKGDDVSVLFSLPRKLERCKTRTKKDLTKSISKIELIGKEDCRCIELNSKDGLYITDNYIVTHNTTTALDFAATCQQPKYGNKHIYYMNIEGRLKEMNLNGIQGLDTTPERFTVIGSDEDKILSAQDYLNIGEKILLTHPECVLIIDSFSMLCHEKEITDGVGTSTRGGGAALLAQFCRQMSNVVPVKRSIVIGIAQLMANTSGYGAAIQEKGGNAVQYQVDVKMRCKTTEPWEHEGKRIGQKLTWTVECSALGAPPGQEYESYIRYGHGIDKVKECIVLGTDFGLIANAGAWYYCDFMQTHLPALGVTEWNEEVRKKCRAQGENNLYELIKSNPSWLGYLQKDISTMLGIK